MNCQAEICHEDLIREFQRHVNQTSIFYTLDGYGYYAQIREIFDCEIALLVPGAGQTTVIIRHPDQTFSPQGTSVIRERYTYLDMRTVVAITSPLSAIPVGFII